jgi:hypothetical protein
MTARVRVAKCDDVWTWTCARCRYSGWTRLGFTRALGEATAHWHWVTTEAETS